MTEPKVEAQPAPRVSPKVEAVSAGPRVQPLEGPKKPLQKQFWALLAAAAIGIGAWMATTQRSDGMEVTLITDPREVIERLAQLPLTPAERAPLEAKAKAEELELWHFEVRAGRSGVDEQYSVKTDRGTHQYRWGSATQYFTLPATRGSPAFRFDSEQDNAKAGMRGFWSTPAGEFPFDMAPGAERTIPVR